MIDERVDNIAHEIIEAIQQKKREQIDDVIESVNTNYVIHLAILYRNYIKCDKCFMKPNCKSVYDCTSMALDYMKGEYNGSRTEKDTNERNYQEQNR